MVAGTLTVAASGACGSESPAETEQDYGEVLRSMKRAAFSSAEYVPQGQLEDLPANQRHVLRAFCNFAEEVRLAREGWKLSKRAYLVARIRSTAYEMGGVQSAAIRMAMRELDDVVDLTALDGEKVNRYALACEGQ